jgi:hypothetical protein
VNNSNTNVQLDSEGNIKLVPDSRGRVAKPGTRRLSHVLRLHKPPFVDLVKRMLVWDPAQRIAPVDALQHPWIVQGDAPVHQAQQGAMVMAGYAATGQSEGVTQAQAAAQLSMQQQEVATHAALRESVASGEQNTAALHAMAMAQQHWERHMAKSTAQASKGSTQDASNSRNPLTDSGNMPLAARAAEAAKAAGLEAQSSGTSCLRCLW